MKKTILSYTIICVIFIGILNLTSCKRGAVPDPDLVANAGFRIFLSGTANPSTLYIPETQPAASSIITVRALHNNGSAASGYTIVFQDFFGKGYFEGLKVSDVRVTDANGIAQITYYIPPAANVRGTSTGEIKATLVDDGRLDNLPISDIYDVIPIRVIPYLDQGVLLHGHILTPSGNGVGDITVFLQGADGNVSGVAVTRPSGSYEFFVPFGWYGTLAPSSEAYTFTPASYEWTSDNPVRQDYDNLDFVAIFEGGNTLVTDVVTWEVGAEGGTQLVNVTNSTGDAVIPYSVTPDSPWLSVSTSSGATPGSFTIIADANTTGADRSGTITVTATGTANSSVTITVNQKGNEVSGDARLAADITSISAENAGGDTTVNVYNSGSAEAIDFIATTSDSWITVDKTSGSTDTTVIVTVAPNAVTSTRTGTVTLTPTSTGVTNTVTITITQAASPTLIATPDNVFLGQHVGDTVRIYFSASDGSSIDFDVQQGITWINISIPPIPLTNTTDNFIDISTGQANTTGSNRTGTIWISSTRAPSIAITVTQSGT
jgi:hypothetical protein